MNEHLPALQVVLPLLAAPICLLIRREGPVRVFATAVCWATLLISLMLLAQVRSTGPFVYAFGDWARPLGIEYAVDHTNALVLVIVSMIAALVVPVGPAHARKQIPEGREYLFYAAFLLCIAGQLGVTITGDAFNVFVFLEIASLSTYVLVALGNERRALMAAYSYLIVGTIGATFLLIGIGMMYQMTGTLNMADLAIRLPAVSQTRTILVAFAFITVGASIKLAVVPLHQWLPNAYTYAPAMVSAFLAATATKVAFYVLVRFSFTVFGAPFVFETLGLQMLLLPLAVIAMFMGSIAAIYQTDFKRLLAYSSIAQIGYMCLGLSLYSVMGLTAGLVHLFNHALIKGGLFLVAGCIYNRLQSSRIEDMKGLGRRMPVTAAALVVGGLALAGVPATVGFVSKWYLITAALEQGAYFLTFLILLSSLLAAIYVWRLVEVMYFDEAPPGSPSGEAPLYILLPACIMMVGCVYFGFFTDLSAGVAAEAANELMGIAS